MLGQSQQFSGGEEHLDREQDIQPQCIEEETQLLAEHACQHADDSAMSEAHFIGSSRRHDVPGRESGLACTREDLQLFTHKRQQAKSAISEPGQSARPQECGGSATTSSAMLKQDVDGSHETNHSKTSSGSTPSTRGGLYLLSRTRSKPVEESSIN